MAKKHRRGGRVSDAARNAMISEVEASEASRARSARLQRERHEAAGRRAATKIVQKNLGPGVDISEDDWDMVYANSEGGEGSGPYTILVANTEIDGIPVIVYWRLFPNTDDITTRGGNPAIAGPIGEQAYISGTFGPYLSRENFGQALRRRYR